MTLLYDKIHQVAAQAAGLPDGPDGFVDFDSNDETHRSAVVLTWSTYRLLGIDGGTAMTILGVDSLPQTKNHPPIDLLRNILDTAVRLEAEEWVGDEEIEVLEILCDNWLRR